VIRVRLLLDVHLSGRVFVPRLENLGHDVRAANEELVLARLPDEELLSVAATEGRILVTSNIKDFRPILVEWGDTGRQHAGCILITSRVRNEHFGRIIAGITAALDAMPEQEAWLDYVHYLS
jgi:Domain of unknown function (DUF5615)